jgi:hypothetical protein
VVTPRVAVRQVTSAFAPQPPRLHDQLSDKASQGSADERQRETDTTIGAPAEDGPAQLPDDLRDLVPLHAPVLDSGRGEVLRDPIQHVPVVRYAIRLDG